MKREEFQELKRKNLDNYKERYLSSLEEAWKLKWEIYAHEEMTEDQKDELWELIVMICEGSDTIER